MSYLRIRSLARRVLPPRVYAKMHGFRHFFLDGTALVRNRATCRVKTRGAHNCVPYYYVRQLRKTRILIIGDGNSVVFAREARIQSCNIVIRGNRNHVSIGSSALTGVRAIISGDGNACTVGDGCTILRLSLVCEDSGNSISIGASTQILGSTELAAIEGKNISIGKNCLFSSDIHFRTGDSHSLTDLQGRRINPSRDIFIGDHVWIGMKVTVLKGAALAGSSVIGACSVVSRRFDKSNCVIAGNPAQVLQEGIDWRVER
jgi:serine acetyltransferase